LEDGSRCDQMATVTQTASSPQLLRRLCVRHYYERIAELRALLIGNDLPVDDEC